MSERLSLRLVLDLIKNSQNRGNRLTDKRFLTAIYTKAEVWYEDINTSKILGGTGGQDKEVKNIPNEIGSAVDSHFEELKNYVKSEVEPRVPHQKKQEIVACLLNLIQADCSIFPHQKELLTNASKVSFPDFLAKIIVYTFQNNCCSPQKAALKPAVSQTADQKNANASANVRLSHNMPSILDRYIARPKEADVLKETIDKGHKQIFIWGEGGIGKTEFAISFAAEVRSTYECFFTTFKGSVAETILGLSFEGWVPFELVSGKEETKTREKQYSEKLALLHQFDRNCILIIDNADISPEQLLNDPNWADMERLDICQLFITRYEFDKANIPIRPFSSEQLYIYLQEYYLGDLFFEKETILELIDVTDRHTLTIDIIGRLIKSSRGRLAPEAIIKALRENTLHDTHWGTIISEYNRDHTKRSVLDHLKCIFDMAALSDDEVYVLKYASLIPAKDAYEDFFLDLIGTAYLPVLDALIEAGWIRCSKHFHQLSMHSLIKPVLYHILLSEQDKIIGILLNLLANLDDTIEQYQNSRLSKQSLEKKVARVRSEYNKLYTCDNLTDFETGILAKVKSLMLEIENAEGKSLDCFKAEILWMVDIVAVMYAVHIGPDNDFLPLKLTIRSRGHAICTILSNALNLTSPCGLQELALSTMVKFYFTVLFYSEEWITAAKKLLSLQEKRNAHPQTLAWTHRMLSHAYTDGYGPDSDMYDLSKYHLEKAHEYASVAWEEEQKSANSKNN